MARIRPTNCPAAIPPAPPPASEVSSPPSEENQEYRNLKQAAVDEFASRFSDPAVFLPPINSDLFHDTLVECCWTVIENAEGPRGQIILLNSRNWKTAINQIPGNYDTFPIGLVVHRCLYHDIYDDVRVRLDDIRLARRRAQQEFERIQRLQAEETRRRQRAAGQETSPLLNLEEERCSLICQVGRSNKYWTITRIGANGIVTYGRIGKPPQMQVKVFTTSAKAKVWYSKMVTSKSNKGYHEVSHAEVHGPPEGLLMRLRGETAAAAQTSRPAQSTPERSERYLDL